MRDDLFSRGKCGHRKARVPAASLVCAQLLLAGLAVLVLGGPLHGQTPAIPQYGYCGPGVPCPNPPGEAPTNAPDKITNREPGSSQRREGEEQEQLSPEERERRLRERVVYEYEGREYQYDEHLRMYLPKPKEYTQFQHFIFSSIGRMLPIYGHDLFEKVPSTFAPVDRIAVTADYVIGPGDELEIRGWGQVQIDVRATVDRTGQIFIPRVGNVRVAGLRYNQLHDYLEGAVGRVFHNFELSVTLGQLRSIQVFVVGHARRPGSYTISSLSTLVNALFAAGGPSPSGSMRNIQVKRNGQVVTEFDFYDLLMNGDKSKDVLLLPGDVIYIPPVGALVAVAGSVNVPAIYEIKEQTTLGDALQFAGRLTATAEGEKATVERVENRSVRKVEEFPLDAKGLARPLQDGDLVSIMALSPRFENTVTLKGNVARPGRYPWREGMRVSDLIPDREMLITRRYWINQNLAPEGEGGQQSRAAAIKGIVPNPQHPDVVVNESLVPSRLPTEKEKAEMEKRERDQARQFRTDEDRDEDRSAKIREEPPGEALIRTEVKRSAPEVNWDYAVVQRLNEQDLTTRLLPFNLGKAVLEREETNNLVLKPGDIVTVFSHADLQVPLAKQTKFIQLEGEFKAAGVYQAQPGDTLLDLVERAGGLTENAYLFGAQFTRESTRVEQQKKLDNFLDQMEQEVERTASLGATRAQGTAEEAKAVEARAAAQRRLVRRLREVRAEGRIVLEMKSRALTLADLPDLPLEDGDRLVIPARPAIVNVIGAVYNENAHLYRPGRRVSDYVRAAGGTTRRADGSHMFVVRADGSVVGRASTSGLWGSSFDSLRLMPGDAIVVPERLEKSNFGRDLREWIQVFSQIALSAAVFGSIAK